MKNTFIAAGIALFALSTAAVAQSPKDGTIYHENGVTYESYIDHEYTLTDPLNAATATGADQIARADTHRKFVPYAPVKQYPHRKKNKS